MKVVTLVAKIDKNRCNNCVICESLCPVLAIKRVDREVVIDEEMCMGCANCEQRCPFYAVNMVRREVPKVVRVDQGQVDQKALKEICFKARHHPEEIICFCTSTRAGEVAAAILRGARSPEEVSLLTGVRTGCKVECIQPILRLLVAAGIKPKPPKGYQWYGITPTIWDISKEVRRKYSKEGFYFDEDLRLFEKILRGKKQIKGGRDL